MRKSILYIQVIALLTALVACGPTDEEKASARIKQARVYLDRNDTAKALIQLDSVQLLYPEAAYSLNAAKNMTNEIKFDLLHRKEAQLDSLIKYTEQLEKPFEKQKTEFDRYTQYVHKRQNFSRRWDRSFIQIHLDERGDLYLSSNYHGQNWLNHTAMRVYDQGLDARTEEVPVGHVNNHRSDFMDAKWEKVSYRNSSDSVLNFIAQHADRRLKAVFLGNQQHYIILEDYDKQAVKDALALSAMLKQKQQLEAEIRSLRKSLNVD